MKLLLACRRGAKESGGWGGPNRELNHVEVWRWSRAPSLSLCHTQIDSAVRCETIEGAVFLRVKEALRFWALACRKGWVWLMFCCLWCYLVPTISNSCVGCATLDWSRGSCIPKRAWGLPPPPLNTPLCVYGMRVSSTIGGRLGVSYRCPRIPC